MTRSTERKRVYDPDALAHAGAIRLHRPGRNRGDCARLRSSRRHAAGTKGRGRIAETVARTKVIDGEAPAREDDEPSRLSGALIADLSAHRTMALREAISRHPDIALAAITHALALDCFYLGAQSRSCIRVNSSHAPRNECAGHWRGSMARTLK
jgi:ParB family chromosome partitioning protein